MLPAAPCADRGCSSAHAPPPLPPAVQSSRCCAAQHSSVAQHSTSTAHYHRLCPAQHSTAQAQHKHRTARTVSWVQSMLTRCFLLAETSSCWCGPPLPRPRSWLAPQCSQPCPCAAQHHEGHSTAQHSTAQRSTAQRSTAQHSTAQHSTALGMAGLQVGLSFATPRSRSSRPCTPQHSAQHTAHACSCCSSHTCTCSTGRSITAASSACRPKHHRDIPPPVYTVPL